jgi:tRNA threonylcarbamoyladenosine biosynthesis protein TsaB
MLVLALDTALDRTAVAVTDGRRLAVARTQAMDRGHAERLFGLLGDILDEAGVGVGDVDRIAVTVGPGSFTGIRVALAAARGLGLATGRPVVGVGTLDALAASCPEPVDGPILAVIDARRGELYAALYAPDGSTLEAPFVADADRVIDRIADRAGAVVGSGAPILSHALAIAGRRIPPLFPMDGPDPLVVARLGAAMMPSSRAPGPVYLRAPDAKPQTSQAELAP